MEVVAADLAMDRRAMPVKLPGDDGDWRLCVEQAEDGAALSQIELAISAGHGDSLGKRLKTLQELHFGIEITERLASSR